MEPSRTWAITTDHRLVNIWFATRTRWSFRNFHVAMWTNATCSLSTRHNGVTKAHCIQITSTKRQKKQPTNTHAWEKNVPYLEKGVQYNESAVNEGKTEPGAEETKKPLKITWFKKKVCELKTVSWNLERSNTPLLRQIICLIGSKFPPTNLLVSPGGG